MEKRERLYKKICKHYIHFLKFTVPTNKNFDSAPDNLLELLDNAFKRKKEFKL
jgi:hypothetical protein